MSGTLPDPYPSVPFRSTSTGILPTTPTGFSPTQQALEEEENPPLRTLLQCADLHRQLRVRNPQLLRYLVQPHVVREAARILAEAPSRYNTTGPQNQDSTSLCAGLCAEILTRGPVMEVLVASDELMNAFFLFLDHPPPLDPTFVQHSVSKVCLTLLRLQRKEFLGYLRRRSFFLTRLSAHVGCDPIAELISQWIDLGSGVVHDDEIESWLFDAGLVSILGDLLHPFETLSTISNAAWLLCETARRFFASSPRIRSQLTNSRTLDMWLGNCLLSFTHVGPGTLRVFSRLLELAWGRGSESLEALTMSATLLYRLPTLCRMLRRVPMALPVVISGGRKMDPPVTNSRIQLLAFLTFLIRSRRPEFHHALITTNVVRDAVNLLKDYPDHDNLHLGVVSLLVTGLEERGSSIRRHLLVDLALPQAVMEAFSNRRRHKGLPWAHWMVIGEAIGGLDSEPSLTLEEDWHTFWSGPLQEAIHDASSPSIPLRTLPERRAILDWRNVDVDGLGTLNNAK